MRPTSVEVSVPSFAATELANDGRHDSVLAVSVVVARGPAGGVTFVRQKGGPFAGRWLLPGGRIEVGESAAEAALRELNEEAGVRTTSLALIGVYEFRGQWLSGDPFQVLTVAFLSDATHRLDASFNGDNGGGVRQRIPTIDGTHGSDLHILADAGICVVESADLRRRLLEDGLVMNNICGPPGVIDSVAARVSDG